MYVNDEQLKEFLIDSGLVARKDIEKAVEDGKKNGVTLSRQLAQNGVLSEDDLRRSEAYVLGIPFVNLKSQKIDPEILSLIPEPIARNHNIVAFRRGGDSLEVAMLDSDDLAAISFVKKKVGLKILPRLTDTESIKAVLLQYQKSLKAEFGDILQKEAMNIKQMPDAEKEEGGTPKDLKKLAEDLPVVRIVETLLNHAIVQNASDIHIEPMEKDLIVRYRIDGILHDAMNLPRTAAPGIAARIKVLSNLKLDEKRLPQDGRFKIDLNGQKVSFRVSTLPIYFGEKIVMRLLREGSSGLTLDGLGFHGRGLEKIHDATKQRTGMILATGPTGSGKTTTLYTVLDMLNLPEVNISTIEDPIEYQMQRINQTQVKPEIGLSFANGLRTLLRQDPDIIMVGEIRDGETAALAVNASLTGHLVISTLHTNSAAGAIPRLVDMGVEPFLLVSTIKVIIAQRLVRKLCGIKEKYFLKDEEVELLKKKANIDRVHEELVTAKIVEAKTPWNKIAFYHPKPSPDCEDGYQGRQGIHEILDVSSAIKEQIIRGVTADEIELQSRKEGMLTMLEDGIFKAASGVTTIEEVFRVVSE